MFSVGLMLRLDSATLDYRQTVAGLTLGGFKMAYIKIQDQVFGFLKVFEPPGGKTNNVVFEQV